ncbi:MAG TPA: hypothetical protein VF585_00545 [Chthoniobacterales bacterium]|jgi:hypothetical protein
MSDQVSTLFQVLFTLAFIVTLLGGVYLVKNDKKLFGQDAHIPADNESARFYNKAQVYAIWAHALLLTGGFAVFLH